MSDSPISTATPPEPMRHGVEPPSGEKYAAYFEGLEPGGGSWMGAELKIDLTPVHELVVWNTGMIPVAATID